MSQEHIGTRNFVQIGLFGGLFGEEYGISFIYFHLQKRDRTIYFTICLWKLERRGMGKCVRNCLYGTTFDFNCLLYKAFWQSLKEFCQGLFMVYFGGRYYFSEGLIAPAIKSALHLPKETIVTTICILYCMVYL